MAQRVAHSATIGFCTVVLLVAHSGCGKTIESIMVVRVDQPVANTGVLEPAASLGMRSGHLPPAIQSDTTLDIAPSVTIPPSTEVVPSVSPAPVRPDHPAGESSDPPPLSMAREPETSEVGPASALADPEPERIEDPVVVPELQQPGMVHGTEPETISPSSSELRDVYFRFDSWMITEEGKQALSGDAAWLREHRTAVAIEGHCDERGTQSYNLVLGEKRAHAIRSYLVNLGIDGATLHVVSYGKERPICAEHDESCYWQNRRGHFVLPTASAGDGVATMR